MILTSSRQMVAQIVSETELCSISCGMHPKRIGYDSLRGITIRGTEKSITLGYVKRQRDDLCQEITRFTEYVKTYIDAKMDN